MILAMHFRAFFLQIQNQKLLKMYLTRPLVYVCILLSENNFHVCM